MLIAAAQAAAPHNHAGAWVGLLGAGVVVLFIVAWIKDKR